LLHELPHSQVFKAVEKLVDSLFQRGPVKGEDVSDQAGGVGQGDLFRIGIGEGINRGNLSIGVSRSHYRGLGWDRHQVC
jgi:hypothetical protein